MSRSSGLKNVRAVFADAAAKLAATEKADPPAHEKRGGFDPGGWPGHPFDKLPPFCPVIPLGKDGDSTHFVDTLGQLRTVNVNKWGKKILLDLFSQEPHFLNWAWPRWGKTGINGLEVDDAVACLLKAASQRGLFNPTDRVRGRGAWERRDTSELLWHSGEAIWRFSGRKMQAAAPGEIDGVFYPRRPPIMEPWRESVTEEETPAHELLKAFGAWRWERPRLDPMLLLGWIGAAIVGGALRWRPTVFLTGDYGQGKSTLHGLVKEVVGDALYSTADTTAAGIYQRVGQDTLPVAVDELEASADNRKVRAVVELARKAASGDLMFRGGSDHAPVSFEARNSFLFAAINPPPLGVQDRSRMAMLNLRKLEQGGRAPKIAGAIDTFGRMILRQLMEAWPRHEATLGFWKDAMAGAGLGGRAQDTYAGLLAIANLMLGDAGMEEAGLDVTDAVRLGRLVADATASERAVQTANWRECLEHLLHCTIDAWKGGEKPTVGGTLEDLQRSVLIAQDAQDIDDGPEVVARRRLAVVGLGLKAAQKLDPALDGWLLAVPPSSPLLAKLYVGSTWSEGGWTHALKQAPEHVVLRDRGNHQVVKISGATKRCVLVNLGAYAALMKEEEGDGSGSSPSSG